MATAKTKTGATTAERRSMLDAIVTTHAADLLDLKPEEQDEVMNRVAGVLINLRRR